MFLNHRITLPGKSYLFSFSTYKVDDSVALSLILPTSPPLEGKKKHNLYLKHRIALIHCVKIGGSRVLRLNMLVLSFSPAPPQPQRIMSKTSEIITMVGG